MNVVNYLTVKILHFLFSCILYGIVCLSSVFNPLYAQTVSPDFKHPSLEIPSDNSLITSPEKQVLEKVTLQLKWFHQFQFAGYYAAKAKGFYQQEGLDVAILPRQSDFSEMNPATSDKVDFVVADSSIVANFANGDAVSILAAIFQHDPLVFISKKDSGIISPYEMIGKRVMYDNTGGNEATLRALLLLTNMDESKYTYITDTYRKEDLLYDKVDVMSAYLTDQFSYFKKKGIELNIINPQNYGIDFYSDLLITSTKELVDHPGRAERFKRASIKGWSYALQHPEELIQIIKNEYHSKLDLENLRFEAKETYKMILPDQIPIGTIDINRLRRVADIYSQLKISKPLSDSDLRQLIYGSQTGLSLTEKEKNWLDQHPVIRVGIDKDFAPFEWLDGEQNYKGMNADYIRLIEKILGVRLDIIKNTSWKETLEMAQNGELDMLSDANKTPEREKYLLFSEPYYESPIVIINDMKNGFINSLHQLKGKKVAIENGYFMQALLTAQYPDIHLVKVENGSEALQFLSDGLVDAYVGDAICSNYMIQKTGFFNLRISGVTKHQNEHRFAVTHNNIQLLSILQKALNTISSEQKEHILNKWRGLHVEQGVRIEKLAKIMIAVICLFTLFTYWLFRLKREIFQRKQVEQALQFSESRFRQIFEGTDVISVQGYNKDHQVIYWNPASETLYGYHASEAMGQTLESLIIPDEMQEQVRRAINDWVNGGPGVSSEELTLKKADATPVHVFSSYVMFKNQYNETEMYRIDIDNTLRKEQADKIEHQAYFDSLTDLPNRMLALDRLSQLLNEAKRNNEKVAVLFLDLDDFKKINDTLGHETGDKLLIEVADRLSSTLRSGDTVGRLGGDEFLILLGGLGCAEEAQPIAENLLGQFRSTYKIDSRELIMTASIGIAIYPEDGNDTSRLLRNADSAMYHAKEQGRNIYSYFTETMNREVSRRLALEEQIHGALERNEFEVFYQPKINISNGKIIGAEALLRWKNPVIGHVSPAEFIPICEQTSLIINVGKFVLVEAMNQTVKWQKKYHSQFYIAVNLSPRQFRDPELVCSIDDIIKQTGLSAASLELEITEGVLMSGHSCIDDALSALSKKGITIAMDDFGTGYSSLSYLRRYPFNVIKIDRSFVNDITVDPADRELINATIVMAHALNLKVVAEGVETQAQLKHLVEMNCDIAQGYLYSKPLSSTDFTDLLESESN